MSQGTSTHIVAPNSSKTRFTLRSDHPLKADAVQLCVQVRSKASHAVEVEFFLSKLDAPTSRFSDHKFTLEKDQGSFSRLAFEESAASNSGDLIVTVFVTSTIPGSPLERSDFDLKLGVDPDRPGNQSGWYVGGGHVKEEVPYSTVSKTHV